MKTKIFALCCLLSYANIFTLQATLPQQEQADQTNDNDDVFGDSGISQSFTTPSIKEFPSVMMIQIDTADNNKVVSARELTPEELQNFQQDVAKEHCDMLIKQKATIQGELVSVGYGAWCIAKGSVMVLFLTVQWLTPYAVNAATPYAKKFAEYAQKAWAYIVEQSKRTKEAVTKRYRAWKEQPAQPQAEPVAKEGKKPAEVVYAVA